MPQNNPAKRGAARSDLSAIFLAVFLLAGCSTDIAPRFAAPEWDSGPHASGFTLSYGVPYSDVLWIIFFCDDRTGEIETSLPQVPIEPADGEQLPVILSTASASIHLDGVARYSESGLYISAPGPDQDELRALFGDSLWMTTVVGTYKEKIPLDGAADAARRFLDTCPSPA
jgi:hypothetical protein